MPEQLDQYKIRDEMGPRAIQALRDLCSPATYWGSKDYDKLKDKVNCSPRTFDISSDVEGLEESVLRQMSDDTELYLSAILDANVESSNNWAEIIKDMAEDIEIYRNAVHMGLVSRRINGVRSKVTMNGRYNILIVKFDITNHGAQVAGFSGGVIHQYPDCIKE